MTEETIIFRDVEWVWSALIKQFEAETGLTVLGINDINGHTLGEEYETFDYEVNTRCKILKGMKFEVE